MLNYCFQKKIPFDIQFVLFYILLALMPFHTMLFEYVISSTSFDNLWRDMIILLLLILSFFKGIKFNIRTIFIFFNMYIMIFFVLFTDQSSVSLNVARTYIIPSLVYIIAKNLIITEEKYKKVIKLLFYQSIIISIFGFVQIFFLGSEFLINLGYEGSGDNLDSTSFYISGFYGYQRLVSTFASPNNCASYLSVIMIILALSKKYISTPKFMYNFGLILIGLGIIATFSRSSFVSLTLVSLVSYIINLKLEISWKRIINILRFVILFSILIYMLVCIDIYFSDSRFTNMLGTHFNNSITGNDSSIQAHLEQLYMPVFTCIEEPLGLGFGKNGSFIVNSYGGSGNYTESSIYLMFYEIGWFAFIYFYPYISGIIRGCKRQVSYIRKQAAYVAINVLIIFAFLPMIQGFDLTFLFYLILGLSDNRSLQKMI